MKALPMKLETGVGWVPCEVSEATFVKLHMPGPLPTRILPVILRGTRAGTGCWSWNGDTEKPTLKPSILSRGGDIQGQPGSHVCHAFVNDGKVQFLGDCSHEFANQTLDLLEVEV